MKSNYRRIGDFIKRSNTKNNDGAYEELLGININKYFMPSVANVVGTDLTKYKIVEPRMFACNRMHVGRDMRLPIALSDKSEPFLVSPAYDVFEIIKPEELLHEYLMMWFTRSEFDRNTWFYTDSDVRGKLGWEDFLDMTLPVPSLEKQQEIVNDYNTVQDRIRINEQLNTALEETAQALYKHWFVDFEFPVAYASSNASSSDTASSKDNVSSSESRERLPNDKAIFSPPEKPQAKLGYKSSGGAMVYNEELDCEIPEGWEVVSFLDELNINGGGTPKTNNPGFWDGEIPFFTPKDVNKSYFTITTEKYLTKKGLKMCSSKLHDQYTIFITARGTVGAISIAGCEMAMNQSCYAFTDTDNLQFYGHQSAKFAIDNLKRQAVGAVFSALVTKDFESTLILKPLFSIKQGFDNMMKPIYTSILSSQKETIDHEGLCSLLLSKMATVEDEKELAN